MFYYFYWQTQLISCLQISPNAKFEIGEEYFPIPKEKFRHEPFTFRIGRLAGGKADATTSSKKRKVSDAAQEEKLPRGIPSKRPKATIVSAAAQPVQGLSSPLTMARKKAATVRGPQNQTRDVWESGLSINQIVDMSNTRAQMLEEKETGSEPETAMWDMHVDSGEQDGEYMFSDNRLLSIKATPQHSLPTPPSPSPMSVATPMDAGSESAKRVYSELPFNTLPPTGRKSTTGSKAAAQPRSNGPTRTNDSTAGVQVARAEENQVTADIQQSGSARKAKSAIIPSLVLNSGNSLVPHASTDMSALLGKLLTTLQHSLHTGAGSPLSAGSAASSDWVRDFQFPGASRYRYFD